MSLLRSATSRFIVAPSHQWPLLWEKCVEGLHPSDIWAPEDWSKPISVKEARSLKEFAAQQAVGAGRMMVIPQADKLSKEVGNALLKLLEEPPQGVSLVLLGETDRMLATIRSRVQVEVLGEGTERLIQFYASLNPLQEPEKVKRLLYYAPLFHATLQTDIVLDSFQS